MILNDEQNDRFFDTMDSLLYYVNERFRVVEGFTLDFANALDDVKGSLVAQTLWENVDIIDEFVRDNPHRLSRRCLDTALGWKYALPGFYALVRYQSGRAILMNEAGVFSVCGVTYELEDEIGPAPAYVETVLLPFDDIITYDGFVQAYDTEGTPSELQGIQDEFENRCAQDGIATGAQDYIARAAKYLAARRDKELEDLLADVALEAERAEEQLPPGFHRGALAGLAPLDREAAVGREAKRLATPVSRDASKQYDKRTRKHEPTSSLAECLMLMTKKELEAVANVLGMSGLMRLRKAEMVAELVAELPHAPEVLHLALREVSKGSYETARTLAKGGTVAFGLDEWGSHMDTWPLEPYVFMFRGSRGYEARIPDELRATFASVDIDAMDAERRRRNQALSCMEACAVMYGVVSLNDAYDQYRALVSDALDFADFCELAENVAVLGFSSFGIWTYEPLDYIVHYTLTPDFVAQEYARSQSESWTGLMRNVETGEISFEQVSRTIGRARADLSEEFDRLESYKRSLLESQANLPMKPLSRTLLENDVVEELLGNENVMRLKAFLDERVPDGQNDYFFADHVVEEVVLSCIESGSLQDVFAYIMDLGLDGCAAKPEQLPLLLTNAFNAMPSWENNGWSPQELYERLTGRKMFYNDDGSVMKIGADDPCPCGSGRKYRECCGR